MKAQVKPLGVNPHRVKAARERAFLSQQDLAQKIGCSVRAVQNWESGRNGARQMRARYIRALAEATGQQIAWFFEEEAA